MYPYWRLFSEAHIHQRARNIPNHVMHKSIGAHIEVDTLPFPRDMNEVHDPPGTLGLAALRPEGTEIMIPDQIFCALGHSFGIQGMRRPGHPFDIEGGRRRSAEDGITIMSGNGRGSRIEVRSHFPGKGNPNLRRKTRIPSHLPGIKTPSGNRIKVNDLGEPMNPGICSSGTNHPNRMVGYARKSGFQNLLDSSSTGLPLPSGKLRAIVFNAERYALLVGKNFGPDAIHKTLRCLDRTHPRVGLPR